MLNRQPLGKREPSPSGIVELFYFVSAERSVVDVGIVC
jgi:hypothetical protein